MAYELFLVRFDELKSAPRRRALIKALREAALAIVPADDPLCEVGRINFGSFKLSLRACEATVAADHAEFRIRDFEPQTVPLLYAIAKAGNLVITNAGVASDIMLINRAQLDSLPPELRDPRPAVCASARQLASLFGVSPDKKPARTKPDKTGHYTWSKKHTKRAFGRGDPAPDLPGLREPPDERHLYLQTKPGEGALLLMKRFGEFLKVEKKRVKLRLPDGGGVGNSDWVLRTPTGDVFVPWDVTGYSWRANSDHLIPANIEAWMVILRDFARQTHRATATIAGAKEFVLDGGRRYPLAACESRRTRDEEG